MKVLLIARTLTTSLSAPHYTKKLSESLATHGCETFLLASNTGSQVNGMKVIGIPQLFNKKELSPLAYSMFGRYLKEKFQIDVVHGHGYTIKDDATTVHFLRRAFENQATRNGYDLHFARGTLLFEKFVLKTSRHLIAPSEMVKEQLLDLYDVKGENVSVIQNGVDIDEFRAPTDEEKAEARKKLGLKPEVFYIGFVGPARWKGLDCLIRAIAKIKDDANVLAINIGDPEQVAYTMLVKEMGLKGRVVFFPRLDDIIPFYRAIDIFVLPTVYDTFSMVAIEAMSSGLPVIVSRNAGISELIEDGQNGFVMRDPRDEERLADLILPLIHYDDLRRKIGVNARRTAERYSWDKVAYRVMETYEKLARR